MKRVNWRHGGRSLAADRYGVHELGMRVVLAYPGTIPTFQKIMADFGVSRSTAYRLLRTLKDVRGIA